MALMTWLRDSVVDRAGGIPPGKDFGNQEPRPPGVAATLTAGPVLPSSRLRLPSERFIMPSAKNATVFNPSDVESISGASYPGALKDICEERYKQRLGNHVGLTNFGVNLVTLKPRSGSALRHWHTKQDEFIYIVSGTATLVTDAGETTIGPGQCAGFAAGESNGHMLANNTDEDVVYLEVGDRTAGDTVNYSDVDLVGEFTGSGYAFTRKNGDPV